MKRRFTYRQAAATGVLVLLVVAGCAREAVPTPDERLQAAGAHARHLLTQAREATNAGEYAAALGLVDSLLNVAPDLPDAHYQRGHILMQLYQLEEADEAFKQAVALDPYHRGGWYRRGHVALEQGRYREAIRLYHRQTDVILSSPKALREYHRRTDETALPQSWVQIGRVYELLQRPDSARWAYEEALALDSTHAQANAWLSGLYEEEGRIQEALAYIRRAWRQEPQNPDFAYQLGTLLLEQGNLTEALPLLEHVVAVQPGNAGAHYNLGRTLIALGRAEEGQQHLALTNDLQDLEQVIGYARAAVARFPDDPARWQTLADLLGRAGRREEQQQAYAVVRALAQNAR
jgi:tetratricopeptide (TPR) repeat protein